MNIPFLKFKKIYYIFSGALAIGSLVCLLLFGLKFGIDFLGGSILEVDFEKRPDNSVIQDKLKDLNLGEIILQPTGEKGVILKLRDISEETHQEILKRLDDVSGVQELRFESIGPVIGKELRQKTIILIIISLAALLIYIAISFRKVSFPFSSLQFGVISIAALILDILTLMGVFAALGNFYNIQFGIPIVTAFLTILGYTINDKVIVFDRVRENISRTRGVDIGSLVDRSLNEILLRSLSTGACSLLVLFFIFFLGGQTIKYFALTLIIGIIVGTYSSLFLASPLLVEWTKWRKRD